MNFSAATTVEFDFDVSRLTWNFDMQQKMVSSLEHKFYLNGFEFKISLQFKTKGVLLVDEFIELNILVTAESASLALPHSTYLRIRHSVPPADKFSEEILLKLQKGDINGPQLIYSGNLSAASKQHEERLKVTIVYRPGEEKSELLLS